MDLCCPHWLTDFSRGLRNLQEQGLFCDVVIQTAECETYSAHANVLAAASPILSTYMQDSGLFVKFDEISAQTWQRLLEFMYTGKVFGVPPSDAHLLYEAARKLGIDTLTSLIDSQPDIKPHLASTEQGPPTEFVKDEDDDDDDDDDDESEAAMEDEDNDAETSNSGNPHGNEVSSVAGNIGEEQPEWNINSMQPLTVKLEYPNEELSLLPFDNTVHDKCSSLVKPSPLMQHPSVSGNSTQVFHTNQAVLKKGTAKLAQPCKARAYNKKGANSSKSQNKEMIDIVASEQSGDRKKKCDKLVKRNVVSQPVVEEKPKVGRKPPRERVRISPPRPVTYREEEKPEETKSEPLDDEKSSSRQPLPPRSKNGKWIKASRLKRLENIKSGLKKRNAERNSSEASTCEMNQKIATSGSSVGESLTTKILPKRKCSLNKDLGISAEEDEEGEENSADKEDELDRNDEDFQIDASYENRGSFGILGFEFDNDWEFPPFEDRESEFDLQQCEFSLGYNCPKCKKVFVKSKMFLHHMRSEHAEFSYMPHQAQMGMCSVCGVSLRKSKLWAHEWRVHGIQTYNETLAKHLPTASEPRYFTCPECGLRMSTEHSMKTHVDRVHNGCRNFSCDVCGKQFGSNQALKHHMFIHTNERRYKCRFCEQTFNRGSHKTMHEALHLDHKFYSCALCTKAFVQITSVNVHMATHHPELDRSEYRKNRRYHPLQITGDRVVVKEVTGGTGRKGKFGSKGLKSGAVDEKSTEGDVVVEEEGMSEKSALSVELITVVDQNTEDTMNS